MAAVPFDCRTLSDFAATEATLAEYGMRTHRFTISMAELCDPNFESRAARAAEAFSRAGGFNGPPRNLLAGLPLDLQPGAQQ
jgi:hypothetical protein